MSGSLTGAVEEVHTGTCPRGTDNCCTHEAKHDGEERYRHIGRREGEGNKERNKAKSRQDERKGEMVLKAAMVTWAPVSATSQSDMGSLPHPLPSPSYSRQ